MKKSLMLFLSGVGLVLATAGPAFAPADNLHLRFAATTCTVGASTRPGGSAGPAALPAGSVGSSHTTPAANNKAYDGAATATHNAGIATLAGMITLLLLQRRYRIHNVLMFKS
jgi:hypothetical protein